MQVMQDCDDRRAASVETLGNAQDLELMIQVEIGRGLIQEQDVRLLGQRHRDPHPLALPAG